jgi:hypothetical protein
VPCGSTYPLGTGFDRRVGLGRESVETAVFYRTDAELPFKSREVADNRHVEV